MYRPAVFFLLIASMGLLYCDSAVAYIGPGAGITILGALWSVIVVVFVAIGSVLLWPFRVLLRRHRNRAAKAAKDETVPENAANTAPAPSGSD
jgi:hypothetical protein